MNKIDEYLKDSNDEADKEIESEKDKNAVIDGQITAKHAEKIQKSMPIRFWLAILRFFRYDGRRLA